MVRSLGADHVLDYTREDFTRGGIRYDVILDMVTNHSMSACRRVLSPNGAYLMVGGGSDGGMLGVVAVLTQSAVLSWFTSQTLGLVLAKRSKPDLVAIAALMESGKVTPVIDRRYALADVPAAIRYLEEGHARGKVVVLVAGETGGRSPANLQLAL
jgi:NADPH:quinone reductase-like Zn-dependent oxidoreductase